MVLIRVVYIIFKNLFTCTFADTEYKLTNGLHIEKDHKAGLLKSNFMTPTTETLDLGGGVC